MEQPREEFQILEDLTTLAESPGYIHAIAHICHRDNIIHIKGELKPSDLDSMFDSERLIRSEVTALIGRMVKKLLDLSQPPSEVIEGYINRTDVLMRELHDSMSYPMFASMFDAVKAGIAPPNPWRGPGMREPIFYGTDSAYVFQYRDFVPEKYGNDDAWMLKSKGFTSGQARVIAKTMCALLDEKVTRLLQDARATGEPPATWLNAFEFSLDEVALLSSRLTIE